MTYKKLLKQLRKTLDIYQQAYDEKWNTDKLIQNDMQFGLCHRWCFNNEKLRKLMGDIRFDLIIEETFKTGLLGDMDGFQGGQALYYRIVFLKTFIDEIEKNMK